MLTELHGSPEDMSFHYYYKSIFPGTFSPHLLTPFFIPGKQREEESERKERAEGETRADHQGTAAVGLLSWKLKDSSLKNDSLVLLGL